ncbi:MAG TPA: glutamate racemase [Candidatus Aminicenantes bacterium]|nr:glutamate racemase [Candidatus Aminicenantes bacterium]
MNKKPIGVFDSGIGGLTVYRAIKQRMPRERVIYLGDTARLPYGSKSESTIIRFSEENAHFLVNHEVKLIVVACNSSSSYAVPHLQANLEVPVIGVIEPGAEAAVDFSRKKAGVIGTTATIMSGAYEKAIRRRNPDLEIISRDCPLFVPLVEEGWVDHTVTRMVAEEYLLPLKKAGIDSLVLGCTHYPVLSKVVGAVMGEAIRLIDSGLTTARQVELILGNRGWLNHEPPDQEDDFFVTDFPERFRRVGEVFLNRKIARVSVAGT